MSFRKYLTSAAIITLVFTGITMPASAQTSASPHDGVMVMNDCLSECNFPTFSSAEDLVGFMREKTRAGAGGSPEGANGPAGIGLGLGLGLNSPQTVS